MSRRRRAQKCWATYSGRVRLLAAGGKSDENILAREQADICLHQVPDPGAHWRFWPTLIKTAPFIFTHVFLFLTITENVKVSIETPLGEEMRRSGTMFIGSLNNASQSWQLKYNGAHIKPDPSLIAA